MKNQKQNQLILALPDYERIFRTIHGILISDKAVQTKSCLFFGIFGASILQYYYKQNARVIAGFSLFRPFSDSDEVLAQAMLKNGQITSSEEGFHCWVEVDDVIIDFSAPLFQEMLGEAGKKCIVERKMLQKPVSLMAESPDHLSKSGDIFYSPNPAITKLLVDNFFSKLAYNDLLEICLDWYKPCPKKMPEVQLIGDGKGKTNRVTLSPLRIIGAW